MWTLYIIRDAAINKKMVSTSVPLMWTWRLSKVWPSQAVSVIVSITSIATHTTATRCKYWYILWLCYGQCIKRHHRLLAMGEFRELHKDIRRKHNLSAMIGTSYSENTTFGVDGGITGSSSTLGIIKNDPLYAYFNYATGTASKTLTGGEKLRSTKLSYFGRVGYDYMGTYFFQGSLRADAADTSILPTNKRWGTSLQSH